MTFTLSAAALAVAFALASVALVLAFYEAAAAFTAVVSSEGALAAFNDSKPLAMESLTVLVTVSIEIAGFASAFSASLVTALTSSFLVLASSFFLAPSALTSAFLVAAAALTSAFLVEASAFLLATSALLDAFA